MKRDKLIHTNIDITYVKLSTSYVTVLLQGKQTFNERLVLNLDPPY